MASNPNTFYAMPSEEAPCLPQVPLEDLQGIVPQGLVDFPPLATYAQVSQLLDALDAFRREVREKDAQKRPAVSTALTVPRLQNHKFEMLPFVTQYTHSRISPQNLEEIWGVDVAITLWPKMIDIEPEHYFMDATFRYIIQDQFWTAYPNLILRRGSRVDIQNLRSQPHMTMCTKYALCDVSYFVENTYYNTQMTSFVRVGAYLRSGHRFVGSDFQWGDIILVFSSEHNDAVYPDALSLQALQLTRPHLGRYKDIRQAAFRHLAHQADGLKWEGEVAREYEKHTSTVPC